MFSGDIKWVHWLEMGWFNDNMQRNLNISRLVLDMVHTDKIISNNTKMNDIMRLAQLYFY